MNKVGASYGSNGMSATYFDTKAGMAICFINMRRVIQVSDNRSLAYNRIFD